MFTSCQEKLLTELKQRIAKGTAGEILPPAIQLAQEFGVNIKTVNKALNRLAAAGLVERRRRIGTVILPNASDGTSGGKMIEIIFPVSRQHFSIRSGARFWKGRTRCSVAVVIELFSTIFFRIRRPICSTGTPCRFPRRRDG